MANIKNILDLAIKLNRLNKDKQMAADLLELSRQLKGLDTEFNTISAARTTLANEINNLKREIATLKKQPAPAAAEPSAQPDGQRTTDGFVWKKS